jgi:hypothetical protein
MIFTTGTGAVGVIYGTLVAKPRNRVKESVKNLMYLKVVFLAYLRQLHQIDQAYTRLLLEKEKLSPGDIISYSEMIKTTMLTATEKLNIKSEDKKNN